MSGSISLSFEREPNYFHASYMEGPFHQTLIARETDSGEVIGVGNRVVRPMFVNGVVQNIGYMSQLRIHPKYGKGLYLARGLAQGFKSYRNLHADGRVPFYLMSIIEDNYPARRLLSAKLSHYPHVHEYARMFTYAIYPVRKKRADPLPHRLQLVRADETYSNEIVNCLNRNHARKQFAPFWTCDSLFTCSLTPADFFIVIDRDRVVGCVACWDQMAFKQTVVRGYSASLARWRKLINLFSRLGFFPYLPEPNTPLRHTYASHLAIDGEEPQIFAALLRAVYNENLARGFSYFMIGLAESNPLHKILRGYRPRVYTSQLYLVAWEDGNEAVARVDRTIIPAPEIAML